MTTVVRYEPKGVSKPAIYTFLGLATLPRFRGRARRAREYSPSVWDAMHRRVRHAPDPAVDAGGGEPPYDRFGASRRWFFAHGGQHPGRRG